MKKTLLITYLFVSLCAFGQTPNFEWAAAQGGEGFDRGRDITTDLWGNSYIIGHFEETVDFDPGPNEYLLSSDGERDIFVSKFTANGKFIWAFSLGSSESDFGLGITSDTLGFIYITGGVDDVAFIAKLDTSGLFLWTKIMGDSSRGQAIAVDNEGNILTTGYFEGTADFDPGPSVYNLIAIGEEDIFISKLNTDGDFLWAKSMGGTSIELPKAIALDSYNNVYTVGYFEGTVDLDPGSNDFNLISVGNRDMFILKLNIDGNFVWAKSIGGTTSVEGDDIEIDNLGNIYVTGYSYDGLIDLNPGPDQYNIEVDGRFVVKLDYDDVFIWAKYFDATWPILEKPLALDKNNNIYITGQFDGLIDFDPGYDTFNLLGDNDLFILKLDSNGAFVWAVSSEGNGLCIGLSITLDYWDNIYTTGSFWNLIDFDPYLGTYELESNGLSDIFIHKMSQQTCSATITISSPTNNFSICSGQEISLKSELPPHVIGFSYHWNTGENTDSIIVSPAITTSYIVNVSHSPACNSSDTVTVFVHPISDTTYIASTSCDSLEVGLVELLLMDQNGCDSIVIKMTSLIPVPDMPIIPSDLTIPEDEPPFQITVPDVPNATGYVWTVPSGTQILSGQGTNTITVDWNGSTANGFICVSAINECGTSIENCMEVIVDFSDAVNEVLTKTYSVYPNPVDEALKIVSSSEEYYKVALYDVLGRLVLEAVSQQRTIRFVTRELQIGTYWLKLSFEEEVFWEQVEVLR